MNRREAIRTGCGGLISSLLYGCGGVIEGGSYLSRSGTGVPGLDTPEQILSNPHIRDLADAMRNEGLSSSFERGINPPVISGRYELSGRRILPLEGSLGSGTFAWRNQTSDNHIDTEYNQVFQAGVSSVGEIIRGEGNEFTVYSILRVTDQRFGCDEQVIMIVDGRQHDNGDVSANYLGTPSGNIVCLSPSMGKMDLTLVGPAKAIERGYGGESIIAGNL